MDRPRPSEMAGRPLTVSSEPPARLPGLSAAELGRRSLFGFAAASVLYFVVFVVEDSPIILIGTGLAWFVLGWVLLGRVGDRLVEESSHGYATFVVDTAMMWFRMTGWVPWDFDGVWKYDRSGAHPPVPGVTDPPGLYPSPHRPDRHEVWTGQVWTKVYRDRPPVSPPVSS